MPDGLKLGRLFKESIRIYFSRLPNFLIILSIPAVVTSVLFVVASIQLLGFSAEASGLDPTTLMVSMTPPQWALVSGAGILIAVTLALGMAATVHAACSAERVGIRQAFGMNTAKSLQIFWLQTVIYALALRFSPLAAPLLWILVAFGSVVVLREDLGPSEGMDRAWELTEGSRLKVLAVELLALIPVVMCCALVAVLFMIPGPWFNLNKIPPYARLGLAPVITGFLLVPVQFMFVLFGRGYEMLKQAEQPALHAKAASGVSSS